MEDFEEISHTGLVARSPLGHAATSMPIKGNEEIWVEIQTHTFRNWVNDKLKETGLYVEDLSTDLCDGVRLVALIEVLQKRKLRNVLRPVNQHQMLENATTALNAITADGIKLVNIGNVDIVNGNLKLILGLIWSLIVHYQIGRSKFPPKKLMLAWLRAVLPETGVNNFTTDWNSGVRLAALLDYCQPGLFPKWKELDPRDSVENCRKAMELAETVLDIPMVLEPEYLASPYLDDLSGMTYLSYFMKENSPGFHATLRWVQSQIPDQKISNFTSNWNDGAAVCELVRSLGGAAPTTNQLCRDPENWESNLEKGIKGGERLGVEPVLKAVDMADPNVEHLGVMAYAAYYQWVTPRMKPKDRLKVTPDSKTVRVNQQGKFNIEYLTSDVDISEITAVVRGPNGEIECRLNLNPTAGSGTFIPTQVGMHEVTVYCEGEEVNGCPIRMRAVPNAPLYTGSGMAPCAVGSLVEVLINSNGTGDGDIDVDATAPTGRILKCPVNNNDGEYTATFQPDEAGEWKIAVTYEGEHINDSPFTCSVFDPNAVKLLDLTGAMPGEPFTFTCDVSGAGWGEVVLDVVFRGRSVPHSIVDLGNGVRRVSFTPQERGKHRVYVYFNGIEVKESPFSLRVGPERSPGKKMPVDSNKSTQKSTSSFKTQQDHFKLRDHDISAEKGGANTSFSEMDKSFLTRMNDRRHSSETNEMSSLSRDNRLSSLERENNKLLSPEKVLSLRRNSADVANDHTSQPLSSLLSEDPEHRISRLDSEQRVNRSSVSKTSRDFGSIQEERSSYVHESKFSSSNVHNSSKTEHLLNGQRSSTPNQMSSSDYAEINRPHIDSASNVKVSASLLGAAPYRRRDSWDALAKTGTSEEFTTSSTTTRNVFSSSAAHDESDAIHSRLTSSSQTFNVSEVTVSGDGLKLAPVGKTTTFTVHSASINANDVSVKVAGPNQRSVPVQIQKATNGVVASFTVPTVGEHSIDIQVKNQRLAGAPFRCFAYDAKEIRVGQVPSGIVGQPVEFEIDGSTAGSGNLEILVNGGHVTSYVRELGDQCFLASFVPHQATIHTVDMKFNGETVQGSPWEVNVLDESARMSNKACVIGEGVRHFAASKIASFDIDICGAHKDQVNVSITSPTKRQLSSRIVEGADNTHHVEFNPSEVGSYVVEISIDGDKLQGSPFIAKAYDSSQIRVSDVTNGAVGQPCQFRVDASQAGEGQLEISINDGEVPNHVQVLGGGKCLVSFTPEQAKIHTIEIKFNGETVPDCPFTCKIADTSRVSVSMRNMELIAAGEVAQFEITVDGTSNSELAVAVKGPTTNLPVKISGGARNTFTAEFMAREVGSHTISVDYNGLPVTGTPFTCKVYDAKNVYVSPMPAGVLRKSLQFTVDASQAGEGNLEITISARGRNIPTKVHPQGSARFAVSFVPLEAIDHIITITFNKEAVPGSPFTATIFTDPDRIVVSGQSLASSAVGKTSYFKMSNVTGSVEDIEINVEGPSGHSVAAQVKDNGDQTFQGEFTPKVAGEHRIHVLHEGKPVGGSPFNCKVYDVNAIKIKEATKGVVGKPVTFLVETSQAGPGNLEVTVNGGQVPTSAQAHGLHTYAISFTPKEPKPHQVELKFNGENVPGSPFSCQVIDSRQVRVSGDGLEKIAINRSAIFFIDVQGSQPTTLDVRVLSPSRKAVPSAIEAVSESRYSVEYTPREVGDHSVEVKYTDVPIHGSPFIVKAYDSNKVRVADVNNGVVGKFVYFSIDASQAGAGNLEIIVSVNGRHVPNYVQSEGNAKFKVSFKPQEPLPHTLSVRFNGEAVPGSPFTCGVADASQIVVSGAATKMSPLNRAASMLIDSHGTELSECRVSVVSTNGKEVPVTTEKLTIDKIKADFIPFEVGPHSVSVTMDGESIGGSPFICNIYDVTKVLVTGLGSSKVGHSITFTVDASQAGEGTLELVVTTTKSSVKADVRARSRGLYDVTFIPQEAVPHFVNITFNDEDVPGSPFKCDICKADEKKSQHSITDTKQITARGEGLKEVVLGAPAFFEIDTKGLDGFIDIRITGPNGSIITNQITRMKSGVYRAEYEPDVVGTYRVEVLHQGKAITTHPFYVEVTDPASVRISEVQEAYSGKESYFILDTSEAGRGTLHVALRAANQNVKHNVQNLGNGLLKVIYFPKLPIAHRVDLRYSGVHASGCPFELKVKNPYLGKEVLAHGPGLYQCQTTKVNSFIIDTHGANTKLFDVVVAAPQDVAVPVRCYQQKDGNLLAQFTAPVPGAYKIDVLYDGKPLRGSPFTAQSYDASRVSVDNVKSTNVSVHESISFQIKKKDAGLASVDVTVVNPLGKELPLEVKSLPSGDGDMVEFYPTLPGKHRFNVLFGGESIPESPFVFIVEEEGLAKAHGEGLMHGTEGSPAQFYIDARGLVGEPTVQIDGPDSICKSHIIQENIGLFKVNYTPQEVGMFDVRVLWNGRDIPGSPFHPKIVNPRKVRVIGGWDSLVDSKNKLLCTVGETKKISFDTLEAGPGTLNAEITGPSGIVDTENETPMPHRTRVKFLLQEIGEYALKFTWNRIPLPHSPVLAIAAVSASDADTQHSKSRASSISSTGSVGDQKVVLTGNGLAKATKGVEAEFTIDGSRAGPGVPEVTITGIKSDLNVALKAIGNNVYRAKYTADIAGVYLLNVMWAERQVKGCPLKVTVSSTVDASQVICSGEGLKWGILGKDIKSFIDTRKTGPGELTAHCLGPNKIAFCELLDHRDGTYSLNIKPQEHGRHSLHIKYGGESVTGSPFNLRVMGAPDASKVRVHGPGIEHGVLATFQSRFLCDTRGAGAGQLTVRVRGPKGAFRVEMQRENQKDRSIVCKYDPTEPGDYRIEVRWSGEHVPGSPFNVMIFDTQEELGRFVQGGYSPQQTNVTGSDFYGSVGYSTGFGHMNLSAMSWRGSQAQL